MKLGNDIIEIDRIRCAIEKSKSFRDRVYTSHEIDYCESRKKGRYESYAGIYAAKEAFIKALGTGMRHGSWQDIEIYHGSRMFLPCSFSDPLAETAAAGLNLSHAGSPSACM